MWLSKVCLVSIYVVMVVHVTTVTADAFYDENHHFTLTPADIAANWLYLMDKTGHMTVHVKGGQCSASGDPHISTIDNNYYDYMGTCAYVMATSYHLLQPTFEIIAEFVQIGSTVSKVSRVIIFVYGHKFELLESGQTKIDGVPHTSGINKIYFWLPGKWVALFWEGSRPLVVTEFGLLVRYYDGHYFRAVIPLQYASYCRGLCGNYDNNWANDFIMSNEVWTSNRHDFGASWKVHAHSQPDCRDLELGGIGKRDADCSPEEKAAAKDMCRLFNATVFRECNDVINPTTYYTSCVFDMCYIPLTKEFKCSQYQTYADACRQALGYVINWRAFVLGCDIICPTNSHFEPEFDPCMENSCAVPAASVVCTKGNYTKTEGCVCNDGYVKEEGKCVPKSLCGCFDDLGIYHKIGESWGDCSGATCTCEAQNKIVCSCTRQRDCYFYEKSTALCLCGDVGCPRICTVDNSGVVKRQNTSYAPLSNNQKHVIAETLEQAKYPCKMRVVVRMDNNKVNYVAVGIGALPGQPEKFVYSAVFGQWYPPGVIIWYYIRGYKLQKKFYTHSAPPDWSNGAASVKIELLEPNVWKLEAHCYGHEMATMEINVPGKALAVLDVKYPSNFGAMCYERFVT